MSAPSLLADSTVLDGGPPAVTACPLGGERIGDAVAASDLTKRGTPAPESVATLHPAQHPGGRALLLALLGRQDDDRPGQGGDRPLRQTEPALRLPELAGRAGTRLGRTR